MFDLVPQEATEETVRAMKLCLCAAGGRVTFTLPLSVTSVSRHMAASYRLQDLSHWKLSCEQTRWS